jgi:hypothetical protein
MVQISQHKVASLPCLCEEWGGFCRHLPVRLECVPYMITMQSLRSKVPHGQHYDPKSR